MVDIVLWYDIWYASTIVLRLYGLSCFVNTPMIHAMNWSMHNKNKTIHTVVATHHLSGWHMCHDVKTASTPRATPLPPYPLLSLSLTRAVPHSGRPSFHGRKSGGLLVLSPADAPTTKKTGDRPITTARHHGWLPAHTTPTGCAPRRLSDRFPTIFGGREPCAAVRQPRATVKPRATRRRRAKLPCASSTVSLIWPRGGLIGRAVSFWVVRGASQIRRYLASAAAAPVPSRATAPGELSRAGPCPPFPALCWFGRTGEWMHAVGHAGEQGGAGRAGELDGDWSDW
jgi:hypothetical protein